MRQKLTNDILIINVHYLTKALATISLQTHITLICTKFFLFIIVFILLDAVGLYLSIMFSKFGFGHLTFYKYYHFDKCCI